MANEIKILKVIVKFKNGRTLLTKCLDQKIQSIYDSSFWNLTKLVAKTTLSVEASIRSHLHNTLGIEKYETVFSKPGVFYGQGSLIVVVEVPTLTKIIAPSVTALLAVSPARLSIINAQKKCSLTVCTVDTLKDEEIKFVLGII